MLRICTKGEFKMNDRFGFQPILQGTSISLLPLVDSDFDELFACASDKQVWAGHPHPDRYKKSVFSPYFKTAIDSKACAVIENRSGKIIGSTRYYLSSTVPDDICIGFTFLVQEHWGGKINYELKKLMLDYAFSYFTNVWFHVGTTNIRSQKAILKIGVTFIREEALDISSKGESWLCYQIERETWQSLK